MTEYLPLIKFSAKLGTSLFAGTTLYCSLVEHPAMLECGTKQAADHWNVLKKSKFFIKLINSRTKFFNLKRLCLNEPLHFK